MSFGLVRVRRFILSICAPVLFFGIFVTLNLTNSVVFAQSENASDQRASPNYLNFLDILPQALKNDDGIKAAKLNEMAAGWIRAE